MSKFLYFGYNNTNLLKGFLIMNKKIYAIIFLLLLSVTLLVGCENNNTNNNYTTNKTTYESPKQSLNEELYSFSTPIKSSDPNRMTNLKITSSRIDGTIVKSKSEFSFYKVIGEPSSKDGYKEADAYGKDNEIIKVVGGGNCQISTTIYNAALGVNGLEVTERHEHDMPVAYVEDGKDATVSYGSLDLKFKNNNDFDIKLTCETKDDKVTVKIFRIS